MLSSSEELWEPNIRWAYAVKNATVLDTKESEVLFTFFIRQLKTEKHYMPR